MFYGFSDILKVKLSMARLLTVVNERKRLRNEYRRHLEDEYIARKKAEEQSAIAAEAEKLKEQGQKAPLTEAQTKELLAQRAASRHEALKTAFEQMKSLSSKTEVAKAPLLDESDLKLMATTQVGLSQGEILRMYVKNWGDLDLRQRRKVMGHINAQRAMHAKEIFLKELAALGRKLGKQPEAAVPNSRLKNKKDPLKLKLEGITEA